MYLSFMIPSSSSSDAKVSRPTTTAIQCSRYTCPTIPFASMLPISGSSLSNHVSGNANTNNGSRRTIPLSFSSPGSGLGLGSGAHGQQGHGNEKDGSGGGATYHKGGSWPGITDAFRPEKRSLSALVSSPHPVHVSLRSFIPLLQSKNLADYDAESLDKKSGTGKGGNLMGMRRWLSCG
ncbi:hypothetical protein D9758_010625 [Tetrapyrgos nigripes]|uniref:Uncharacterized protein n=1 Tax=Tetrapyrgos nigripes TaxID=182062 RepID=A0A8H5FXW8_9AGAR|nr:hypothetical protein D9758_010625 [Tetrapyrgos nigripes]